MTIEEKIQAIEKMVDDFIGGTATCDRVHRLVAMLRLAVEQRDKAYGMLFGATGEQFEDETKEYLDAALIRAAEGEVR